VLMGSSPERSFLAPEIAYLAGLARRLRNVRLAALNLKGISEVDLGGIGSESVISENLGFHLNLRVFSL